MRLQLRSFIGILTIISLCCGSKVEINEIVGSYIMQYPYGTEELLIEKRGYYMQTFRVKGENNVWTNKGKWEYDEKGSRIILLDAILIDDNFGKMRPQFWNEAKIDWMLGVKKASGTVYLRFNPDFDYTFKKVD